MAMLAAMTDDSIIAAEEIAGPDLWYEKRAVRRGADDRRGRG